MAVVFELALSLTTRFGMRVVLPVGVLQRGRLSPSLGPSFLRSAPVNRCLRLASVWHPS